MKYIKSLTIILIIMMNSCKTSEVQRSFILGKGGGFTGKYEIFQVKSNGEVFKVIDGQPAADMAIKIDKKQIVALFNEFDKLNITVVNFSYPGNMTYFIRYSDNNKTYEIKWGSPNVAPPQNYVAFFEKTWSLIRKK